MALVSSSRLFTPAAWGWGTVCVVFAALAGVVLHAVLFSRCARHDAATDFIARTRSADLCIAHDDDLRHPGWSREEQARTSHASLPDPRSARWFVRPIPWKATR